MYYLVKLLLLHLRTWKSSASSSVSTTWLPSLRPRPLLTWTTTCWRTLLARQVATGLSKTKLEREPSSEVELGKKRGSALPEAGSVPGHAKVQGRMFLVWMNHSTGWPLGPDASKLHCYPRITKNAFVGSRVGKPLYSTVQKSWV